MSEQAPPIGDYGLIGDCHSAALVSCEGSIDWCCLPRFDSGSCFGRLLDRERGGFCAVSVEGDARSAGQQLRRRHARARDACSRGRRAPCGSLDFLAMREHGALEPRRELIRIVECERGSAEVQIKLAPRFDYGAVRPWLRRAAARRFTAIGGDDGLLIWSDDELSAEREALLARGRLHAGERLRLLIRFVSPHLLEREQTARMPAEVDARLEETIAWWRSLARRVCSDGWS